MKLRTMIILYLISVSVVFTGAAISNKTKGTVETDTKVIPKYHFTGKREIKVILNEIEVYKEIAVTELEGIEVPDIDSSKKTYMDYRKITRQGSKQLKLQELSYTNNQGIREHQGKLMVAMGTYYGTVGDEFKVTLETGEELEVIIGDVKADEHTDSKNQHHAIDKSVIEFIIDSRVIDELVLRSGDCSYLVGFGKVVKIERIEK